ncbi:PREDICTED: uncharacterized protein LOC108509539 [Lepidothrix coronata]|uniref:Uncharacterized protein LOC108509539 n=1 Tax=Lepidothrix coronata TaxID=321398 RepID=A0A6J0J6F2_9PASS|nr:PREDICTED: uncharacterized protein LOC108509539 [Lepidothrix coronata]
MPSTGCCPGPWSRCSLSRLHPSDPAGISLSTHKSSCSRRRIQPGERWIRAMRGAGSRGPRAPGDGRREIPCGFFSTGKPERLFVQSRKEGLEEFTSRNPWKCPRPGWSNLGWWKVSCPWHRGDWLGFKVPSNPTHPGMWRCFSSWIKAEPGQKEKMRRRNAEPGDSRSKAPFFMGYPECGPAIPENLFDSQGRQKNQCLPREIQPFHASFLPGDSKEVSDLLFFMFLA